MLDRLIYFFLPDIHYTFNAEAISASHFASPWFLTIFGGMLNNNKELLIEVWDLFLCVSFIQKGWKVVFGICIAILDRVSPWILNRKFEDIM